MSMTDKHEVTFRCHGCDKPQTVLVGTMEKISPYCPACAVTAKPPVLAFSVTDRLDRLMQEVDAIEDRVATLWADRPEDRTPHTYYSGMAARLRELCRQAAAAAKCADEMASEP